MGTSVLSNFEQAVQDLRDKGEGLREMSSLKDFIAYILTILQYSYNITKSVALILVNSSLMLESSHPDPRELHTNYTETPELTLRGTIIK